ncbi:PP2C family protein-serine/threonine phosphatase [Methanobrevibacter millerae]|uniref:Sigma-B regulation protein RsbU (Phosphoserine phosphatase) n=1 Tax=Methanobrevibacter millerae TaxID=230361 RepID=A0A1G5UVQ9_9EURY|nr:PP2C family protein-serine/threonine phosphatase [Methanobrevibacter millerae]SDA37679.1 sigma-B regulation protein RsbU (phosphoserine phosphatase) [Methanobrevibacter millerae]
MNSITLKPDLNELYALNELVLNELPEENLQVNLIVEEIFVNIVCYSKSEFITVNAEYIDSKLILEFIDNGIRFISFIIGIIGIWVSKKINFIHTPQKSKRKANKRLYKILFSILIILTAVLFIQSHMQMNIAIAIAELALVIIILYAYLTKPIESEVASIQISPISEKIMNIFLFATLIIAISGLLFSIFVAKSSFIDFEELVTISELMPFLMITDIIILLFFIPGMIVVKYVENTLINPIKSFSQIGEFVHENQKIETEGLLDIYSKYINENNEIGTLAQSYTDLINYNNNYIENIQEIEGEKERLNAEIDIATKIQAAALPTEAIITEDFTVDGYSRPAKEVGGDFFDYYPLDDDNLAIVIGDASGKGIPAAIVAMITQVMIKQMLKDNHNPSEVLYSLNNQLNENNPETMFITLWLGIYNRTTSKLTFSNAGHNPPLINENGEFKYLNMDTGIVLGIMEDFEYENEEITLTNGIVAYTDGITDANNKNNEMYGEERLLKFFNEFKSDEDPIVPLLNDINTFTEGNDQFDDMTLLYLKIKND